MTWFHVAFQSNDKPISLSPDESENMDITHFRYRAVIIPMVTTLPDMAFPVFKLRQFVINTLCFL